METINIRRARDEEASTIYQLHIDSIQFYCSAFYNDHAIKAWIKLKTPEEYKNSHQDKIFIVAEEENNILGFGLVNIVKQTIESIYIKPNTAGRGIGRLLIMSLEEIARDSQIKQLKLNSTINAVNFYRHMGYKGEIEKAFQLSTGDKLPCFEMIKIL